MVRLAGLFDIVLEPRRAHTRLLKSSELLPSQHCEVEYQSELIERVEWIESGSALECNSRRNVDIYIAEPEVREAPRRVW